MSIARAGETFQIDGVAVLDAPGAPATAAAAARRGFPVTVLAATPEGAAAMAEAIKDQRPLIVPPAGAAPAAYVALAARLGVPLVVSGADLAGWPRRR